MKYIREANLKQIGRKTIEPFSKSTIEYITNISGGNARKTLRICYHAFQVATAEGRPVSRKIIKEITQDQFGTQTEEHVKGEINRVIERAGLAVEFNKTIERSIRDKKTSKRSKSINYADYWISVGDDTSGIAITHVHDVFSDSEEKKIVQRTSQLSSSDSKGLSSASILIVSGFIAEQRLSRLSEHFDKVVLYTSREFSENFESALSGFRIRIEERLKEDKLDLILNRMRQLERQLASMNRLFDNVASKSDINTLIQLARANDNSRFALSPTIGNDPFGLEFQRVFNAFDSLDRLFVSPFYSVPSGRSERKRLEISERISSKASLPQFYLLHGLTMMYYFAEAGTQEDEGFVSASHYDISRSLQSQYNQIIMESCFNWNYSSLAEYVERNSNSRSESTIYDSENLITLLQKLSERVRNKLEWSTPTLGIIETNERDIKREPAEYSNFVVSRFAELNDTYFSIQNGLNSIMRLLLQNSQRLFQEHQESKFIDDLRLFFYLYRMSFLFIDIVVSKLESSLLSSSIKELRDFCPFFDEILAYGSNTYRKSSRLGILRYLERSVVTESIDFQSTRNLDDLISDIFKMPRKTYDQLRSIGSRYSLGGR